MTIALDGLLLMNKQRVTLWIFAVLFLIRLNSLLIPEASTGDNADTFSYFYILITFSLLAVVIWLNKANLSLLNIDTFFVYIFILAGILLFLCFGLSLLGIAAGVSVISIFNLLRTRNLIFDNKYKSVSTILIAAIGITPVILWRLLLHDLPFYIDGYFKLSASEVFGLIVLRTWGTVYEEMLFRGMLWMILSKWKFSNSIIVLTQALLFWVVHANSVSGFSFWVTLPIFSLWLGFLVVRSKSLVPSTIAHLAYNFTAALIEANL
jgi:membrane protease YdiL (CAAX protease family)